jgi:pyruvate dehydrogenase E1 component beta subunit
MRELTYRDAIREALREEIRRDERVFIMGEDVAVAGGAFNVTQGLRPSWARSGSSTPAQRVGHRGGGGGASLMGMRPVAEVMFADFCTIAMDAIVNHAAKIHYMSGGEMTAPLVVRMAYGAGPKWGSHHTQSVESWLANVPGLTIVMPSTPADAKGLLKAAIRTPNPVIFLEHKLLYGKKGGPREIPRADRQGGREARGDGVTIVATGLIVDRALGAARSLARTE